jgi:hypothetical protein
LVSDVSDDINYLDNVDKKILSGTQGARNNGLEQAFKNGTTSRQGIMYFDSNDEMFFEDENDPEEGFLNDSQLSGAERRKMYTKMMKKATEEERQKIREQIYREKKRSIQMFLQEVN